MPYFFSDLADWASFEYVGPALAWDDEVVEGDMAGGAFTVWYLADGKVVAMLSAGGHGDIERARALIASGGTLELARVAARASWCPRRPRDTRGCPGAHRPTARARSR